MAPPTKHRLFIQERFSCSCYTVVRENKRLGGGGTNSQPRADQPFLPALRLSVLSSTQRWPIVRRVLSSSHLILTDNTMMEASLPFSRLGNRFWEVRKWLNESVCVPWLRTDYFFNHQTYFCLISGNSSSVSRGFTPTRQQMKQSGKCPVPGSGGEEGRVGLSINSCFLSAYHVPCTALGVVFWGHLYSEVWVSITVFCAESTLLWHTPVVQKEKYQPGAQRAGSGSISTSCVPSDNLLTSLSLCLSFQGHWECPHLCFGSF